MMKRIISTASNSLTPSAQRARIDDKNGVNEEEESTFFLKHQNRALGVELQCYKRTITDLEKQLKTVEKRQRSFDATLSAIHRVWQQLEEDLRTSASTLNITVHNDLDFESDDNSSTIDHSDAVSEVSLMRNLLKKTGQLSTVDITDPKVLRLFTDVKVPERSDPIDCSNHERVFCGDLSDLSYNSEEESERAQSMEPKQVDASLQRRANYATELMANVMCALKSNGRRSKGEGTPSLLEDDLLAQKREAKAATACLSDSLTLALQQRAELSRELRQSRRKLYQALRKVEHLSAAGKDCSISATHDLKQNGSHLSSNGNPQPIMNSDSCKQSDGKIDHDSFLSTEKFEELKSELISTEEISTQRLAEIEQLKNENLSLESEITRLRAQSISFFDEKKVDFDKNIKENAKAMFDYQSELLCLREALKSESALLSVERNRAAHAEKLASEAFAAHNALQETVLRETSLMHAKWKAQVEGSNVAMGDAMIGYDSTKSELDLIQLELSRIPDLHFQLESACRRLRIEEAESRRLRGSLERANAKIAILEAKTDSTADMLPSNKANEFFGSDSERVKILEKKLAEITEELSQTKNVVEIVMAEVEMTAGALDEALTEARTLSERLEAAEKEILDTSSKIGDIRLKCELLTTQKSALEWRCEKAENMKNQAEAIEAAVRSESALQEIRTAEAILERDNALKLLTVEQDLRLEATSAASKATSELQVAKGQLEVLVRRCDELTKRENLARSGEQRAKEQVATAQRRAERAKQNLSKVQARLEMKQESSLEKESALLTEEVKELRKIMRCSVCSSRQKNCVLTKCYHMFCRECIDENLRTRHRKCPACGKGFGADDVHPIWLT